MAYMSLISTCNIDHIYEDRNSENKVQNVQNTENFRSSELSEF